MSLKAIAMSAAREPGPLVTRWRSRTVANVDSIALVTGIRFSVLMFGCGFQDRGVWCDHPGQRHREHESVGR
ncbi:hypothetical protein, partial [Bradyrhizobium sp. ERR14]|uniref:hypothetical protein n=1 Tax=Bradyrhizobium sp. ERR14 TaxID=2663837 RepID=UPI00185DD974